MASVAAPPGPLPELFLSHHAVSFSRFFQLMTGQNEANVGINQAYFLSDANITRHAMVIFVGINSFFHPIDTAQNRPNLIFLLASARFFTCLIQHEPPGLSFSAYIIFISANLIQHCPTCRNAAYAPAAFSSTVIQHYSGSEQAFRISYS